MEFRKLTAGLSVMPQITPQDIPAIAAAGYRAIICNRPDGEGADQPNFEEIETAAAAAGLQCRYLPIVSGKVEDADALAFREALVALPGPALAYCRTGTRSATLWSLAVAGEKTTAEILQTTAAVGYDMSGVVRRIVNGGKTPTDTGDAHFEVVIVGGALRVLLWPAA